jgi:hypothetical protein
VSGHVFHPGHHELHGVTVVVDATGDRTFIGRFDRVEEGRILLLNVAVHDPAVGPREEFIRRSHTFGVAAGVKHLALPESDVTAILGLADAAS